MNASAKLARRAYWMDMDDRTLVGHDQRNWRTSHERRKKSTSTDLPVKHLIDQISVREILLPES